MLATLAVGAILAAPTPPRCVPLAQSGDSEEIALETLTEEREDGTRAEWQVRRDAAGEPVMHGEFQSWFPGGQVQTRGLYVDGRKVGKWQVWSADGVLRAEEHYRRGLRNGEWRTWKPDGSFERKRTYEAQFESFEDGRPRFEGESIVLGSLIPDGRWRWFWPHGGVRCEGWFQRGYAVGDWRWYWWDGGVQYEGTFERVKVKVNAKRKWTSRRVGDWVFRHRNGCADPGLLSATFRDGERLPLAVSLADSPEPHADPLPEVRVWPDLPPEETREIARSVVLAMGGTDEERASAKSRIAAWDAAAFPTVLTALRELDLSDARALRAAGEVWPLLPKKLLGGVLDEWRAGEDAEAAHGNSLQRLRWLTLWELYSRDPDAFLELKNLDVGALEVQLFTTEPGSPSPWNAPPPEGPVVEQVEDPLQLAIQRAPPGGEGTEDALRRAIAWLCAAQAPDGSWAGEVDPTAFALLALAGVSTVADAGDVGSAVDAGARWLLEAALPIERATPAGEPDPLASSARVALALAEAVRRARNPALRRQIQTHFDALLERRREDSERERTRHAQVADPRPAAWEAIALQLGHERGFRVQSSDLDWVARWLDAAARKAAPDDLETVGLLLWCRRLLGGARESAEVQSAAARLLGGLPDLRGRDVPDLGAWLAGTYALQSVGGSAWDEWNEAMKQTLVAAQAEDGSWGLPEGGGPGARVLRTASGALALEVYFRFPARVDD